MRLLMYISHKLIDSISLEHDKITLPGYIGCFIRRLKEKHNSILTQTEEEPEFLVQNKKSPNGKNLKPF